MRDIQSQQQQQAPLHPKPEPPSPDSMSYDASCSSSLHPDDDDDDSDPLLRRRRRSDLDGDDLAESSAARRRHSRILSRWAARQAQDMITTLERRNRESELMALAGLHPVSMLLRDPPSAPPPPTPDRPSPRPSPILQMWRQLEDHSTPDSMSDARDLSPDPGDVERERVRQIVRGLMDSGINDPSSHASRPSNNTSGGEWLGETERERVRLVREWVQMATQQRARSRDDQLSPRASDLDQPHPHAAHHEDIPQDHIRRDMLRLRGRQALIDLLVRIESERQRELEGLMEHRAVSDFAHRNRIQFHSGFWDIIVRGEIQREEEGSETISLVFYENYEGEGMDPSISLLPSKLSRNLSNSAHPLHKFLVRFASNLS